MPKRDHDGQTAVQRLLTLRKFPGFAGAELGELAIIAENVVELAFEPGDLVVSSARQVPKPGTLPVSNSALHLVIEGQLENESGVTWGPHEVCGAIEAMARRRAREDVRAAVPTRTLRLGAADFREILEDNFGLLTTVRRLLARELLAVMPLPPTMAPNMVVAEVTSDQPLGMVERLMVLRKRMPFGKGRIEALAALAQAAEEVRVPARTEIAAAGELPTSTLILLDGTVTVQKGPTSVVVGPGHAISALEVLAQVPMTTNVTTITPIRALRCPVAPMYDVLEDHTDLALAMVESLASALVDRNPRALPLPTEGGPEAPSDRPSVN